MNLATPTGDGRPRQPAHRLSEVLGLYPLVREDHLKTLQKCGLLHPPDVVGGERFVEFADVAVIRQVNAELQRGAPFRSVLRSSVASQSGQLALDFQVERQPAKVLTLRRPPTSTPGRTNVGGPGRPAAERAPADPAMASTTSPSGHRSTMGRPRSGGRRRPPTGARWRSIRGWCPRSSTSRTSITPTIT